MKKFLIESSLFAVAIIASVYFVFLQADGKSDPFYSRTTTPKQSSLILGTSKAAQGLMPEVLKPYLRKDSYNFSFTVAHSPFGPAYLSAIEKKLEPQSKDGVFIITVDPWSISSDGADPNNESQFGESKSFMGTLPSFSSKPNISYLLNNYGDNYIKILWNFSLMQVHTDGWLEVFPPMDSASVKNRTAENILEQKLKLKSYKFSETRFEYLKKTIKLLKNHGKVYLVRLPVDHRIAEIETELLPDFDEKIEELAKTTSVPYLSLMNSDTKFTFTDGIHLYRDSAKEVSAEVGEWISKQ
ncbi:hypothetical protein POV26_11670 [Aequorivita todarodis]|uniref:hypothetical protein n=1 Tax=Aequorivita todarodis TaxID=2036821 RepID=UPI00235074CE|nr:hypothetical protein [Aequorivita todarodis]MDC8001697.1 hypothetical protein [Aequorivita todarodis]